jgi:hypothetical protein
LKVIQERIGLNRADAGLRKVTAQDLNGYPQEDAGNAENMQLRPDCVYYLIQ